MSGEGSFSKKITILYIITGLDTGGAEIMLCNLLAGINKEKIFPVVISLAGEGSLSPQLEGMGVRVYNMNMRQGKIPSLGDIVKIIKLAGRIRPDIIHGWMYHGNLAALLTRFFLFRSIRVLWTIHHSVSSIVQEKPMTAKVIRAGAWLSGLPSRIIYVSEVSRKQHALLGYSEKKAGVITNGVDINSFVPATDSGRSLREELKLPGGIFLVGLLARYHPMKDHENFLQAAALLQKRKGNVHFILAGTNVDWNNTALKEILQRLQIQHISILGERSDSRALIGALDILSLSSAYGEAFPLVILEAMSCEVPCVATDVGDIAIIIGDTGQVVPPRNSSALADAWENMMRRSTEERKALGKAAREKVSREYTLESVIEKYEKLYQDVISFK